MEKGVTVETGRPKRGAEEGSAYLASECIPGEVFRELLAKVM